MPKLHEVIAVESDLEAVAKKVLDEAKTTFTKKVDHFMEQTRVLEMFDEQRQDENVSETKSLVTTVRDKLDYIQGHLIKYYDLIGKKELTNQSAKADLVVDGKTLVKDVPATLLLGLESRLKRLREVYETIPTLQPGVKWEVDAQRGKDIYTNAHPEERMRTEKQIQHKVLYEATKEHPAQIENWSTDVAVGKFTVHTWSGMISPSDKSKLLERIDTLIRAVKKARQRANTEEVKEIKVGKAIFDFING